MTLQALLARWTRRREDVVSPRWLKEQQRLLSRVEFHGPSFRWPIRKLQNEARLGPRRVA